VALIGHVIGAARRAAIEQLGTPTRVALTCPVAWAPAGPAAVKRPVLRAAAQLAGVGAEAIVLDEAEAAAHHIGGGALPVEEDELFALYDIGGGTCDIAVLRRELGRLRPLALAEAEIGGEHFDWLLYEHVLRQLDPVAAGAELAASVRRAKEQLSAADRVVVEGVTVTAGELDALLEPDVRATADELHGAIARATELGEGDVTAVHVVGGSSLLPIVPRLLESVTGLPVQRADQPRVAVALGAVQALEAWSGPGRPTRRGGRGAELHARRVLAAAAMGDAPVLLHTDAAGACALSRLDPARGAADRTVAVDGEAPDTLVAGDDIVAATAHTAVRVWDAELRAVELGEHAALPGPVRALHASPHGVWIVYEHEDGSLWLRTIVVPDALAEHEPAVRDVAIAAVPAGDSTHPGGAPGLTTAARGQRLLVAARVRGAGGTEQQVFAAAADGRLRKVATRAAAPWLLDWLPTPLGAAELEGGLPPAPIAARLGDTARLAVAGRVATLLPSGGSAAVIVGTADGWEAHRLDPSARGGTGSHLLCREPGTVSAGVPTADGGWITATTADAACALLISREGVSQRATVPEGARPLCAAAGRLYVLAGDELRSVAVTAPRTR
jgi:hypothetical protein